MPCKAAAINSTRFFTQCAISDSVSMVYGITILPVTIMSACLCLFYGLRMGFYELRVMGAMIRGYIKYET